MSSSLMKNHQDLIKIFLFEPLTPRLRKFAIELSQTKDEISETQILDFWQDWQTTCGDAAQRIMYLIGAYHWLNFLVGDLLQEYAGVRCTVHPWLNTPDETINIPKELCLDPEWAHYKLSKRTSKSTLKDEVNLENRLEKDRALVKALFRLPNDLSRPAYFDKILTARAERKILSGMRAAKKSAGRRFLFWRPKCVSSGEWKSLLDGESDAMTIKSVETSITSGSSIPK